MSVLERLHLVNHGSANTGSVTPGAREPEMPRQVTKGWGEEPFVLPHADGMYDKPEVRIAAPKAAQDVGASAVEGSTAGGQVEGSARVSTPQPGVLQADGTRTADGWPVERELGSEPSRAGAQASGEELPAGHYANMADEIDRAHQ